MKHSVGRAAVQRLTWLLLLSQSLSSAAFITGSTVGALVAAQLSGQAALAGLPGAVHLLSAALAAYPAARLMDRHGRRAGLAVMRGSFAGFMAGSSLLGFTDLARYAAAEMHAPAQRGRAISRVVLGGTAGAIAGPVLVAPASRLGLSLNFEPLAGPWFASALLFAFGLILIARMLRPDPRDLAWSLAASGPAGPDPAPGQRAPVPPAAARPWRTILRQPATQVAVTAMVVAQLVMVMLSGVTPLHLIAQGRALADISLVIMAHTLGMYGLSMVTGRLADRFGRPAVIASGGGLLAAAGLLAPLSTSTPSLGAAMLLLGLGWNFLSVPAAALLTDSLTLAERSRYQGTTDLAVGFVSAVGSLQSAALFAWLGYARLSWIGVAVALVPVVWAGWQVACSLSRAGSFARPTASRWCVAGARHAQPLS